MSENAELYLYKENAIIGLRNWLHAHNVEYTNDMDEEELRELYIAKECEKI